MGKITCAICIAALLILLCAPVRATEEPAFQVSAVTAQPGETVQLTISLNHNPGIASAKLEVRFPEELTLESVAYGTDLGGMTMDPQSLSSPVSLNWISPLAELSGDVVYATLTFAVSEDAAAGEYPVTVSYDADNVFNMAEENVAFAIIQGGVTIPQPQTQTSTGDNPDHGDPLLWVALALPVAALGTTVLVKRRKK